jgi:polar amino acid transport system permease protein
MGHPLSLLSFGPDGWGDELLRGAFITISLALATLPLGLSLGLLVALAQRSGHPVLTRLASVYTTIFRGLPELLTLYLVYFGAQFGLQWLWKTLGFSGGVDVSPFIAGMFALGLVLAAFSSEVWVGALNAIPKGQREGAHALGLDKAKTFRLVVFPQLLRVALPGLGNNWMVLLKETSLVSTIALHDLMFMANRANITTKEPFVFFGAACLIYLVFSLISMAGLGALEKRSNRGFEGRA